MHIRAARMNVDETEREIPFYSRQPRAERNRAIAAAVAEAAAAAAAALCSVALCCVLSFRGYCKNTLHLAFIVKNPSQFLYLYIVCRYYLFSCVCACVQACERASLCARVCVYSYFILLPFKDNDYSVEFLNAYNSFIATIFILAAHSFKHWLTGGGCECVK